MNADEIAAVRATLGRRVEVFCEAQRDEVDRTFREAKTKGEREVYNKRARALPNWNKSNDDLPTTAAELDAVMYPIPEGAPDPFQEDFPPVKTEDEQLGRPA